MKVEPYLNFDGRCEEALEFYKKAIGAKVEMIMRMKEAPEDPVHKISPGAGDKILHASFQVGESTLMASDGYLKGQPRFEGVSLSITVAKEAEVDRLFNALAQGGKATMAPTKTFYSPRFAMVEDKFGLQWMLIVPAPR